MPRMGLTPDKVVSAAGDLADRDGLDGLSLSVLAETLGIRVPSLYKHIDSLDDLRQRVATDAATALSEGVRAAADGHEGRDALIALAQAYRRFGRQHPGRYEAMRRAFAISDRRIVDVLTRVLGEYRLGGDDVQHGVRAVQSALDGFVGLESSGGAGRPADADASFYAMLSTLDRGLTAGAPGRSDRGLLGALLRPIR